MFAGRNGGAKAAAGAAVNADGKEVGWLTTCAVSPRLGPIAMAYIHRDHFTPGTELRIGAVTARVSLLPLAVAPGA